MLTEKENYLMCLKGECPEWVPEYSLGVMPNGNEHPACVMVEPSLLVQFRLNGGGKDIWGVNFVGSDSTGGALIPEPNNYVMDLDDMEHWQDFVKAPDISHIDWEKMVKEDIERSGVDRTQSAMSVNLHFGYFQQLVGLMGFENGMMAMYEYPDEVKEMLNYLCDFYCEVAEKTIDLYKPDIWTMMDDTAAWANPFISPEMYREFLIPVHDRQAKFGRDRGLPITMHNCGKCESILDDLVGIGVTSWDPAQTCNDLVGIKKKYGNRLVLSGGWDARDRLLAPDVTDEEIYESVKQSMDTLAPGGGYVFMGFFMAPVGQQEETNRKNAVLKAAVKDYGHKFYKK